MARDLIRLMQLLFPPAVGTQQEISWQPSADVYRTPCGWLLKFEVAGVPPENIFLEMQGCQLTIQGTRRDWIIQEGCTCYRMEISYSRFERSVELPCNLERARIHTDYRYGMLLVHIETEASS